MWRKKHRSCLLLWKENWKLPLISTFNEEPIIRCLPTRITMLCYDYCAEIQPTNVSYAACRFIGRVSMSILCCKQKPLWLCGGPNTYLCVDNNDSNCLVRCESSHSLYFEIFGSTRCLYWATHCSVMNFLVLL